MLLAKNIQKYLREFEFAAKKLVEEANADHAVYAWEMYDGQDSLSRIYFYEGIVLKDEEIFDRTGRLSGIVYALHKRKQVED